MSQLKQRLPSSKNRLLSSGSAPDSDSNDDHDHTPPAPAPAPALRQSNGQRIMSQTFASTAYLANLLPTGTLLAFQMLTPIFTNNGQCDATTRSLTTILLATLAISCFLASFTDSLQGPDGQVYYGLATRTGMWLFDYPVASPSPKDMDLAKYKLRFVDFVHAVLSMVVFGVVGLRDKNVVTCFDPMPSHEVQEVLDIVPIGVGLVCSLLFVVFPTRRHGIGYPVTPRKDNSD